MLKYLQTVKDRLVGLKAGITSNEAIWVSSGNPETPASVQAEIELLEAADAEIESLKDQVTQKTAAARALVSDKNAAAEIIEKRAVAIHATNPDKLVEYNIHVRGGAGSARELPEKAIIKSVTDDDDGIGFKIAIQTQGRTVDFWEIERGEIVPATRTGGNNQQPVPPWPNPSDPQDGGNTGNSSTTVLQPPYAFLKSTKKLTYVDDDVEAGVRYFYRVRGVNTKGGGAWSEPVSAVQ